MIRHFMAGAAGLESPEIRGREFAQKKSPGFRPGSLRGFASQEASIRIQPKMSAVMPAYQPSDSSYVRLRSAASSPVWLMKPSVLAIFSSVAS